MFVDAGIVVIVSFISPYRAQRQSARSRFAPGEFLEVFVDAPLDECERRDPKGLYAKARRGEVVNFTGIDSDYEPPETPDIRLDTVNCSAEECVDRVLSALDLRSGIFAANGSSDYLPCIRLRKSWGKRLRFAARQTRAFGLRVQVCIRRLPFSP